MPFFLWIGLRYLRSSRRYRFISLSGLISVLSMALGVMTLITVLSVLNGFSQAIQENFFKIAQAISITSSFGEIDNWRSIAHKVAINTEVVGVSPFVASPALLNTNGKSLPISLLGVLPEREKNVSALAGAVNPGKFSDLLPRQQGILLSREVADRLGTKVGQIIHVILPKEKSHDLQASLVIVPFRVMGLFYMGESASYANTMAFVHLRDAQRVLQIAGIHGFRVKVRHLDQAPSIATLLKTQLTDEYEVKDWTQLYGAYFESVKLTKQILFFVLLLIIAVAVFNMLTKSVMVVTEKKAEIAILRTLGATSKEIVLIFMVQGIIIGSVGIGLGLVGGILLSSYIAEIVTVLQHLLHVKLVSQSIYRIDTFPAHIQWQDIINVSSLAFLMSLSATLYPAYRAMRLRPAQVLRCE